MDKGVKGLLVGDLSHQLLLTIERSIGKYQRKCERVGERINELLEKNQTIDEVMRDHFSFGNFDDADSVYSTNAPSYAQNYTNFQNFLVTLDKKDWRNEIKVKQETNYFAQNNDQKGRKIVPSQFNQPENMQLFMNRQVELLKNKNEDKLTQLKQEINATINTLYEEILQAAMDLEQHRIPIHGIDHPTLENPVNLF
jgi:hypothetical protein